MSAARGDIQVGVFGLGEEEFALPVTAVREILDHRPAYRVPGAPAWFLGLTDVRGDSVPMIDLRVRLGLMSAETTLATRMLSALVVESFDKGQMATVNGMRGSAAWIASFLFSLLIGVTADKIGFNPLFIAMGFFDLIGAVFLVAFIAERRAKRA